MIHKREDLERTVLEVVSRDFEPFEIIASKLSLRTNITRVNLPLCRIKEGILRLQAIGLLRAFLLHSEPPFLTMVRADSDDVQTFWYFITPTGRRFLSNSCSGLSDAFRPNSLALIYEELEKISALLNLTIQ